MRGIENYIFDLDGTLVDSLPGIQYAVDEALSLCGVGPRTRDLRPLIGPPIRAILKTIAADTAEADLNALERAFRSVYDSIGWRMTVCQPGAAEALAALQSHGKRLFLVTNKPLHITEEILGALGIRSRFTDVAARDSRKPALTSKAEMLRDLAARHALDPRSCLVVGDTAEDYDAAAEAGMEAAIVAHGYSHDTPPCRRLEDFAELTASCAGIGGAR